MDLNVYGRMVGTPDRRDNPCHKRIVLMERGTTRHRTWPAHPDRQERAGNRLTAANPWSRHDRTLAGFGRELEVICVMRGEPCALG